MASASTKVTIHFKLKKLDESTNNEPKAADIQLATAPEVVEKHSGLEDFEAVSIPKAVIEQYTFWPLKWLLFICFAISGTTGKLLEMHDDGDRAVVYDSVSEASQLKDHYRYFFDCTHFPVSYHTILLDLFVLLSLKPIRTLLILDS